MNFLNFISVLSLFKLIPLILSVFILNSFLQDTSTRKKFLSFLVIFILFIILGLFFSLDGIILLFIISEFAVLLIFLIIFSQLTSFSTQTPKKKGFLSILFLTLLNISTYDANIILYKSFYSQQTHQLNDFFYFFNYYFEKQALLTVFIIILITVYSLFFIILYFMLKSIQNSETTKNSKMSILRKQNILKQSVYNTKTRFFQK